MFQNSPGNHAGAANAASVFVHPIPDDICAPFTPPLLRQAALLFPLSDIQFLSFRVREMRQSG